MTDINPPAYLDRDGQVWPATEGGDLHYEESVVPRHVAEGKYGPLVPLWPEGKAPKPDAYVWTQGDDEAELKERIVAGAHVAVESGGVTYSGLVTRDADGWKRIGGQGGAYLTDDEGDPCIIVRGAHRVTIVPPEGKAPLPENAYVWTQGDDEESLLARLVAGAHVTVESWGVTMSGPVTIDPQGDAWLASMRLSLHRWELANAVHMDRITVVPPPEPVLPEWVTYRSTGYLRMIAATSDGMTWWKSGADRWLSRSGGEERLTSAELIARGGRLLIDHNGRAVES